MDCLRIPKSHVLALACCSLLLLLASPKSTAQIAQSDLQAQLARFESQIAQIEGNYDQSSAELLRSAATVSAQLGNVDEAIYFYREALQALRINEGLASESQLAVLEEFNVLLFAREEWEELDTNYHLAADMTARMHGYRDERHIDAVTRLASWKIRAYQTGVYRPGGNRSIQDAAEIYRVLVRDLEDAELARGAQLASHLSAQGLAYYYAAHYTAEIPVSEFQGTPGTNSFQSCMPTILSVDGGAQPSAAACQANAGANPEYFASKQREKNNLVRGHLGNMRQSFLEAIEAIEANPEASLRDQAIAILNYGDANLLTEDFQRARSQYSRAYELLSSSEEAIRIRTELLGRPVKALQGIIDDLPFDQELLNNVALGTISFDVTERGEIENINIEGTDEALDRENVGAIAMLLDQSVYRPKIVDGSPVASRISLSAADL